MKEWDKMYFKTGSGLERNFKKQQLVSWFRPKVANSSFHNTCIYVSPGCILYTEMKARQVEVSTARQRSVKSYTHSKKQPVHVYVLQASLDQLVIFLPLLQRSFLLQPYNHIKFSLCYTSVWRDPFLRVLVLFFKHQNDDSFTGRLFSPGRVHEELHYTSTAVLQELPEM